MDGSTDPVEAPQQDAVIGAEAQDTLDGFLDEKAKEIQEWRDKFPKETSKLRACLFCARVKTEKQFLEAGCENCTFLNIRDDTERVFECTSDVFAGLIGMTQPSKSWVAKWQNIDTLVPGAYAISVTGVLPVEVQQMCQEIGKVYVSRDTSIKR